MKTFVITVSKNFLAGHPRKGEATNFPQKILKGEKIHTIRGNYKYWKKIADKVNQKEALLSIRMWTGKPYKSKQEELCVLRDINIKKVVFKKEIKKDGVKAKIIIDGNTYTGYGLEVIANNDGLSLDDFISWFPKDFKGCIIYFTSIEY